MLRYYDGRTGSIDKLQLLIPGVPRNVFVEWAAKLGLTRHTDFRWTAEEVAYLVENIGKKKRSEIAKHLNRTDNAVRFKVKRIGLIKTNSQERYTVADLTIGLGCNHDKVQKWIKNGWLKGYKTESEQRNFWLFSEGQIRNFIREHPHEIDPRRMDWLWIVDILTPGGIGEL